MSHRHRKHVVMAWAIAAAAGFAACSSDEPTVASNQVVGEWSGTTAQDRSVEFTVTSAGVTEGHFGYRMTGECNFITSQDFIGAELRIAGGEFTTGKTQIGQGAYITVSGTFITPTTSKGTMLIQHAPCGDTLSVNWTASKN